MYSLTRALMGVLAHLFDSKRHASQRRHTAAGKRASFRPLLEALEDRLTPAQLAVTSAADPAKLTSGTLRYAVNQANSDAAQGISDTIIFQSNLSGAVITLTHGQLELSGSGQASIAIDGSSLQSPVTISGARRQPDLPDRRRRGCRADGSCRDGRKRRRQHAYQQRRRHRQRRHADPRQRHSHRQLGRSWRRH